MSLLDKLLRPGKEREHVPMGKPLPPDGMRYVPADQTGIKRFYKLGPEDGLTKTAWGTRSLRRRRTKNKVAKQSRKVNRRG